MASTRSKVRLVLTGHGARGEVYVDGVKLEHVQSVRLNAERNEINTAVIEIMPDEIEVEGEFITKVEVIADASGRERSTPQPQPIR